MWIERISQRYNQWIYKVDHYEIVLINFVSWAKTYEVIIRSKDFKENKVIYVLDFDIAKLKALILAKELGWDIGSF